MFFEKGFGLFPKGEGGGVRIMTAAVGAAAHTSHWTMRSDDGFSHSNSPDPAQESLLFCAKNNNNAAVAAAGEKCSEKCAEIKPKKTRTTTTTKTTSRSKVK